MNFNYSYRAFLVTSLLFGILFLTLWSIRLSSEIPEKQEMLPIEYEMVSVPKQKLTVEAPTKITTNNAYNEAERFIKEAENERLETDNSQEISETKAKISEEFSSITQNALQEATQRLEQQETEIATKKKATKPSKEKGINTKTTIRYSLKDRKAIQLPNPVYVCEAGGKVVITVEVNELGKILKASYNKAASTITNGCLIDSALEYANRSQFNTKAGATKQLGTITYLFPGQG